MTGQVQQPDKTRYQIIPRVLIFAVRGGRLLLLKGAADKKTWPNLFNGIGGHVESGENILAAARREFLEETGLRLQTAHLCAVVTIEIPNSPGIGMYVFKAIPQKGIPRPSDEGTLEWIDPAKLSDLPLVNDLPVLIPKVLEWTPGCPIIFGQYTYSPLNKLVITFTQ